MYTPVVGLEIHVQVKTKSKMFCRCNAEYFNSEPNTHTCPVCFGLPGALPVPNKEAFKKALNLALALNCKINQNTKFDRKNYFYPDLAKGYQISQYDKPIGEIGYLEIEVLSDSRRIRIQRIHLEEDTAKSIHTNSETLINYNKSGIPLAEIVTFPDFESVEEVILFAKRLKQLVKYLDVSDAKMQEGQMRFELNISLKPDSMPANVLPNYKVEVKNIGSISVLEKVLNLEIKRQQELLDKGEVIKTQTRGLKSMNGETVFQRFKESSDDYRYFPEPDIPPIKIEDSLIEELKKNMVELPHQRKQRYMELGLEGEQADIFVEDTQKGDWFDSFIKIADKSKLKEASKWLIGDISAQLEKLQIEISQMALTPTDLLYILNNLESKKISGTIAKEIINTIFTEGGSAESIVEKKGLVQITDSNFVMELAKKVIENNAKVVADISKNPNAIKFLVGMVMRESKGKVNPKVAEEEILKLLQT